MICDPDGNGRWNKGQPIWACLTCNNVFRGSSQNGRTYTKCFRCGGKLAIVSDIRLPWKVLHFGSYEEVYWTHGHYLESPRWLLDIRPQVLERDGKRCAICGAEATEVHHRDYSDTTLKGLSFYALVSVCRGCHGAVTFGWPYYRICKVPELMHWQEQNFRALVGLRETLRQERTTYWESFTVMVMEHASVSSVSSIDLDKWSTSRIEAFTYFDSPGICFWQGEVCVDLLAGGRMYRVPINQCLDVFSRYWVHYSAVQYEWKCFKALLNRPSNRTVQIVNENDLAKLRYELAWAGAIGIPVLELIQCINHQFADTRPATQGSPSRCVPSEISTFYSSLKPCIQFVKKPCQAGVITAGIGSRLVPCSTSTVVGELVGVHRRAHSQWVAEHGDGRIFPYLQKQYEKQMAVLRGADNDR